MPETETPRQPAGCVRGLGASKETDVELTSTERMALAELASTHLWSKVADDTPELNDALKTALPKLRGQAGPQPGDAPQGR